MRYFVECDADDLNVTGIYVGNDLDSDCPVKSFTPPSEEEMMEVIEKTTSGMYDIPFQRRKRIANQILSLWENKNQE